MLCYLLINHSNAFSLEEKQEMTQPCAAALCCSLSSLQAGVHCTVMS